MHKQRKFSENKIQREYKGLVFFLKESKMDIKSRYIHFIIKQIDSEIILCKTILSLPTIDGHDDHRRNLNFCLLSLFSAILGQVGTSQV